ncbi:MAG: transposase [Candidatus Methylacidiphilales bacterium]
MQFEIDNIYHIYNQGNNKQKIFHSAENYLYFLNLYRKFVLPHADLLAYCLMPNHFHFLVNTNSQSIKIRKVGSLNLSELSNGIRMLLSSYSLAINKQKKSTGSQFRQKTQAKLLKIDDVNYPFICFQYIHQNPLKAGLVERMEDWEFSSFKDYLKIRNGSLCNQNLAINLIGIEESNFLKESYAVIYNEKISKIFNN